jgi:hypothetical protein
MEWGMELFDKTEGGMIIDKEPLDKVNEQTKASPRMRMNNFHQSLDEILW